MHTETMKTGLFADSDLVNDWYEPHWEISADETMEALAIQLDNCRPEDLFDDVPLDGWHDGR